MTGEFGVLARGLARDELQHPQRRQRRRSLAARVRIELRQRVEGGCVPGVLRTEEEQPVQALVGQGLEGAEHGRDRLADPGRRLGEQAAAAACRDEAVFGQRALPAAVVGMALGSDAEAVLREAPVPVLLVRTAAATGIA